MGLLNFSIGSSRLPCGNMQHVLAVSGTSTSLAFCRHIGTHRTALRGEKPSFLLFDIDFRSPTEACYLPTVEAGLTDVRDYREELMLTLTSARELVTKSIRKSQSSYKHHYDQRSRTLELRVGDWVLIHFPNDETGHWRKLSRLWHGPYRVTELSNTGAVCMKVYFPQDGSVRVHQSRVCACPPGFLAGYYWYGGKR